MADLAGKISANPFRLGGPLREAQPFGPLLLGIAERALAFERLANVYRQAQRSNSPAQFARAALRSLQVEFDVPYEQIEFIPGSGPSVVVANHPFGGLEGLYLLGLLLQRRSDVKLVANELLQRIPERLSCNIQLEIPPPGHNARECWSLNSRIPINFG